jgi:SAM-dependent methyltransferase
MKAQVRSMKSESALKYESGNLFVRFFVNRFLDKIAKEIEEINPERIVDLGCGEGFVPRLLRQRGLHFGYLGVDVSASSIESARIRNPGLDFLHGNILEISIPTSAADLILCTEVLEHLEEPARLLARISKWPMKAALFSVPWEPFFRLGNLFRGKHLSHFGNHPEHIQNFGIHSFRALVAPFFPKNDVETAFPWMISSIKER